MPKNKINLLVIAGAMDNKFLSKIAPVVKLDQIDNIYVASKHPINHPRITSFTFPQIFRKNILLAEIYRLLVVVYILATRRIHLVMGIYLFPHGILASVVAKFFGKKLVQNIIGDDLPSALASKFWFYFVQMADCYIVRGENNKQDLVKKGIKADKIYCIPNVFDFAKVPLVENKKYLYDLIFIGNIEQVKRPDILLHAIAIAKQKMSNNFTIAILGEGPLKEQMLQLANKLGISENIEFLGYQNDVYAFLNQSRIFIMTSQYEGLPMAMIEAMSCGLPCIVPNISSIPTVAKHNYNSLLVTVGDTQGFALQIHTLLSNQELYHQLAINALKIREQKRYEYSLENTINLWEKILESVT